MEILGGLPFIPQIIRQISVFVCFAWLCYRYWSNNLAFLLILMFFPTVFMFFGATAYNVYKILVLFWTCWCVLQRKSWKINTMNAIVFTGAFVVFCVAFLVITGNSTGNTFTIIFSQLARYVEFYLLYFLLYDAVSRQKEGNYFLKVFYDIILMQIIMTIVKLIVFRGGYMEALVGSMSIGGGAIGTSLPIIGFIALYLYRGGKLSSWDWLFVAGLMMIGYTSAKRAIWFILPIVIAAFLIYVHRIRLNRYMILGLCAAPILFYFGARLTPTLNPEHKVWGSFDLDYIYDYAETYQFGKEGLEGYKQDESLQLSSMGGQYSTHDGIEVEGRGGATIALIELLFSPKYTLKDQDIYGLGFSNMYSIGYGDFKKLPLTIHINHKGSATGIFQSYVAMGYVGVFTTILLMFFPFFFFKHKRLQWVILAILAWEYFMYTGLIFRTPAFMAVLLFVLHYTNKQYEDYWAAKRASKAQQLAEREAHRKQLLEAAEAETA